jgi:hypothetical protein
MAKNIILAVSLLMSSALDLFSLQKENSNSVPRIFSSAPTSMLMARKAYQDRDQRLQPAFDRLKNEADNALEMKSLSVMEKSQVPPSGDKHDYMSMARYYWPDSTKPNGLPYVSRDGVVNPEILTITDAAYCGRTIIAVQTLGLAYYIFGDERYAEKAATFIRVWFLNPETKMNPNMTFAQGVRGMDDGRPAGTIETRDIGFVCDAIGLIAGSKTWKTGDQEGMIAWFTQYLDWFLHHPNAIAVSRIGNNLAVWYAVQAATVALFVGREDVARQLIDNAREGTIAKQIEPDGSQPRELTRTISSHYVFFNLEAFFRLASVADRLGMNLWNYRTADGRSIRRAFDWVIPYMKQEKEWKWKQIKKFEWSVYYPLLLQASIVFGDQKYLDLATQISDGKMKSDRSHLFFMR